MRNVWLVVLFFSVSMQPTGDSLAQQRVQNYSMPFEDPCVPMPPSWVHDYGYASPQQRLQACTARRRAQWSDYYARRARQAAAAAAAQVEAKRQAAAEEARRTKEQAAQWLAEISPGNYCKTPDFARKVIAEWNYLESENGLQAVDIEHLITTEYDGDNGVIACHGVFKTSRGIDLIGTLSIGKNVAGDLISHWKIDPGQEAAAYMASQRP